MGEQSNLNGAYYGPSIPPQQRSYHSHSHGRGRGCGPCCFLGFLCKLIVAIVLVIGIAVLVIWLVYRPSEIKLHVVDASLREFNLSTSNNQIHYNFQLSLSLRNTNRKIGIYYDRIQANAFYQGQWFAATELDTFFQPRKNTTMLHPIFRGTSNILFSSSDIIMFNRENNDGSFNIDVKLNLRIRFKVGDAKSSRWNPKFDCDVRVPLASNTSSSSSAVAFDTKRCKFQF